MKRKVGVILGATVLIVAIVSLFSAKEIKEIEKETIKEESQTVQTPTKKVVSTKKTKAEPKQEVVIKKANLSDSAEGKLIPFSAMTETSDLSNNIKNKIESLYEKSPLGLYFLERKKHKIVAIVDKATEENDSNISLPRHEFEIVEISIPNGETKNIKVGLENPINTETPYDKWEYVTVDGGLLPAKHTHYDIKDEVEYVEHWNYSPEEQVKYKLTDAIGNVISLHKISNDDNGLRDEHIFYNKDGKTTMNVSTTFKESQLSSFTYYNADKINDSATVLNEFQDGVKTKETVYSDEYKVLNTYVPTYENGERKNITVFDGDNKEIDKVIAE